MGARPAPVTQADIARTIRAAQAAGLPILRIVVTRDGVVVETSGTVSRSAEGERRDVEAEADSETIIPL
ncbi:hypothetical protein [Enterovirga rhinocerotis]|nr:hypothetical protein [Enterovirga rhinocerotis]